jgi:hypothetical protein
VADGVQCKTFDPSPKYLSTYSYQMNIKALIGHGDCTPKIWFQTMSLPLSKQTFTCNVVEIVAVKRLPNMPDCIWMIILHMSQCQAAIIKVVGVII